MDSWYDLDPWACMTKLRDVRNNVTWPGLMRKHGLIRGWAYPRDSTVLLLLLAKHPSFHYSFFSLSTTSMTTTVLTSSWGETWGSCHTGV